MRYYNIILETLTPTFIGNGNTITKKDYTLIGDNIYIYDPFILYKINPQEYERFLLGNLDDTLSSFLKYSKFGNAKSAIKYSLNTVDGSIRERDNIAEFIKDPYGCPYIPGSSLKGAIRTAVLNAQIRKKIGEPDKFERYRNISYRTNAKDIETSAFGEINEDKFKHIIISDSKALSTNDLTACKKIDIFIDGKSNNKLNFVREAIKPRIKVEFKMSIDNDKINYTEKEIMSSIRTNAHNYYNDFSSNFKKYVNNYGDDILYLGGGTGFATKTINYSLYGESAVKKIAKDLNDSFRIHKHIGDINLGFSPRTLKCTRYKNNTIEMGICKIRIEECEAI